MIFAHLVLTHNAKTIHFVLIILFLLYSLIYYLRYLIIVNNSVKFSTSIENTSISRIELISIIFLYKYISKNKVTIYKKSKFKMVKYSGYKFLSIINLLPWILEEELFQKSFFRPAFLARAKNLYINNREINLEDHVFTILRNAYLEPKLIKYIPQHRFLKLVHFVESQGLKDDDWTEFIRVHTAYRQMVALKQRHVKYKEIDDPLPNTSVDKILAPGEKHKIMPRLFQAMLKAAST